MKNKKYAEMFEAYTSGLPLSEVGKRFGMTRQSVYIGFERRGYALRKKNEQPVQFFRGEKFTKRNTGYFGRTTKDRKLMHIVVWEHYHGPIPAKHDIHHANKDRTDNRIENLELYSKAEHARKFSTGNNQYGKRH